MEQLVQNVGQTKGNVPTKDFVTYQLKQYLSDDEYNASIDAILEQTKMPYKGYTPYDFAYGFTAGFLFGYAAYLFVHYLVHALQPPQNALKVLWVNHAIHHYKNPDVAYGVTTPFWDFVFRTLPKKKTR